MAGERLLNFWRHSSNAVQPAKRWLGVIVLLNMGQFDPAVTDFSAVFSFNQKMQDHFSAAAQPSWGLATVQGGDADIATAKALNPKIADQMCHG